MSIIDKISSTRSKEEINPTQKYPIIWKVESCLQGECRGERTSHRWSIPFSTPGGLVNECYDCHKTRQIQTESKIHEQEPSGYAKQRLAELRKNEK